MSKKLECAAGEGKFKDPDYIHECGWNLIYVFAQEGEEGGTFSYSLGNYMHDLPEVILTGNLNPNAVGGIFQAVIDDWKEGKEIVTGGVDGYLQGGYKLRFVELDVEDPLLKEVYACQLYYHMERHGWDKPFRIIQLVWPNVDGTFGCEEQPLLKALE